MEYQRPESARPGTYLLFNWSLMRACGGDSKKPNAKYVIAYNKITKDRYLPYRARTGAKCAVV